MGGVPLGISGRSARLEDLARRLDALVIGVPPCTGSVPGDGGRVPPRRPGRTDEELIATRTKSGRAHCSTILTGGVHPLPERLELLQGAR